MPATQIDLLASPLSATNREQLEAAGVPIRGEATRQEVRDYFLDVLPKKTLRENGLFWLFWGGRGLASEGLERRLILSDATNKNCENLHLESLITRLRQSSRKLPTANRSDRRLRQLHARSVEATGLPAASGPAS